MGKRATAACQSLEVSQRPQRRRKKTSDDAASASASASASGLRSSRITTGRRRTRLWQQSKTPDDAAPDLGSCSAASQSEQEPDAAPHRGRTQVEQRPRQGKKPNTARRLLDSCATATAQARRRRAVFVSWGAKRSRTVRFGNALGSRWRDWAGLDEGPAGLIAERVLTNDVADYVRFRAACLPWRRCCADPCARGVLEDPRLYPRQWILLRDNHEELATAAAPHRRCRRRFLNTHTGQCIQVDVPELRDHGVLQATADGLLVLHCKTSKAVRLLNPLTRQLADLPLTAGIVDVSLRCIGQCTPFCAGLLDHSTVYLYFYSSYAGTKAIAQPGDDRWVLLNTGRERIECTVFFAGRFYGVTVSGIIVTVDMAGDDRGPRLMVEAERPETFPFSPRTNTVHLVDNGDGDLRLVHRVLGTDRGSDDYYTYKRMYSVYRVNLRTGKTTTHDSHNLGGRAIFIDFYCESFTCMSL